MLPSFSDPAWLWLALLALPCAAAAVLLFRTMTLPRRWSAAAARVALLSLLAAAIAGAGRVRETDALAVIAVIDVSGSVRRHVHRAGADGQVLDAVQLARAFLDRSSAARGPDDRLGVVVFDGSAAAVAAPARAGLAGRSLDVRLTEGTDIASALRLAAAMLPPDAAGRLVLLSDGAQTAGDAAAAAADIAGRGGASPTIDVVPLTWRLGEEVLVERVDAPPRAVAGTPLTVRVLLRATAPSTGTLRLTREGEPIDLNGPDPGDGLSLSLEPGRRVVPLTVELPPGRLHRFEAVYEPDPLAPDDAARSTTPGAPPALAGDSAVENNRASAFTLTDEGGRVLVADRAGPSTLVSALRDAGIEAEVIDPRALPTDLLALNAYDALVLVNVPREDTPDGADAALARYVRELGGGLVVIGGPEALGAGNWQRSDLAEILPVLLEVPDEVIQNRVATVFVLDRSGSMARPVLGSPRSQQAIANESAALAIGVLGASDEVGVIAFDDQASVVVPLATNDDPARAQAAVRSIAPGGGTNIGPGLELAAQQLARSDAPIRHIIVLTDGRSRDAEALAPRVERLARDGVRVTTIAVGDEADEQTLARMAQVGGGAYYRVSSADVLPRVFLSAVRVVRTPLLREAPFTPVVLPTASPLTADLTAPAPLGGLVLTRPRDEPAVTLAMASPEGEPVLAHWPVELGQAAVFTSDASPAGWASAWAADPIYRTFWPRLIRFVSRPADPQAVELALRDDAGTLRLTLDASADDGRPIDRLTVPVTLYASDGSSSEVTLAQTGPGRYEASAPSYPAGTTIAIARPRLGTTRLRPVLGGLSLRGGAEFAADASDDALLAEIARLGRGRVLSPDLTADADLFARAAVTPRRARTPLWPALVAIALVVFVLDVGTRRLAWDRLGQRGALAEALRDRSAAAARAVGELRARDRVPVLASGPATPLDETDAARAAAEARRRRLDARRAAATAATKASPPQHPEPRAPLTTEPAPRAEPEDRPTQASGADDGPSGLLAAKKRARQRIDES